MIITQHEKTELLACIEARIEGLEEVLQSRPVMVDVRKEMIKRRLIFLNKLHKKIIDEKPEGID